ncbi:MAG: hypothetical protein NTW79_01065 [Candidatus Berkelbacteria bacterium]|nr:hypothetical protein [Candidatus Berkelbacteria bacterium]
MQLWSDLVEILEKAGCLIVDSQPNSDIRIRFHGGMLIASFKNRPHNGMASPIYSNIGSSVKIFFFNLAEKFGGFTTAG